MTTAAPPRRPLRALNMAQADRLFASGRGRPEQFGMTNPEAVFAALTNVSYADGTHGGIIDTAPPQWVGESINKARYRRSIADLVTHVDLTRPDLTGFDASAAKPTGGTHDEAGGAVQSGNIKFTMWGPTIAYQWATGNAFDRSLTDFGIDANLLSSYVAAAYEIYSAWVDQRVFDVVLNTTPLATTTASGTLGNLNTQWSAIVDGIVKVLPYAIPTFALVPVAAIGPLLKAVPPGVLDLIRELTGEQGFKLRADTAARLTTGQSLVGAAGGVDLYELPGAPVRVSATNVNIGTTDVGVFGYAYPKDNGDNYFALMQAGS